VGATLGVSVVVTLEGWSAGTKALSVLHDEAACPVVSVEDNPAGCAEESIVPFASYTEQGITPADITQAVTSTTIIAFLIARRTVTLPPPFSCLQAPAPGAKLLQLIHFLKTLCAIEQKAS